MKTSIAVAAAILFPLGLISPAHAHAQPQSEQTIAGTSHLIAGFGRIRLPGGGDSSDDVSDPAPATSGGEFSGFSGDHEPYTDTFNGFSLDVPVEFEILEPGQTTNWTGPILDEGATSIYVNAAPLPGVDSGMLQQTYRQQYENDSFYTDVQLLTVPYGNGSVPALRTREVDTKRGTNTQKSPDDIHRWHLIVFGNERVYTWGFTGMFQTFQDNEVQDLYETVIDSVELVGIDQ